MLYLQRQVIRSKTTKLSDNYKSAPSSNQATQYCDGNEKQVLSGPASKKMSQAEKVITQIEEVQPRIRVNNRVDCYLDVRPARKP